jgi:hypothetical protein
MPEISELRKLRQEDSKFEASIGEICLKNQTKTKQKNLWML